MKRAGAYFRVSTQDQNTDLQKKEVLPYIASRGWDIRDVYEEKATGTNTRRPELQRLLADCRARKVDVVVVWKLDRMFRSLKDMIVTLQELNEIGVEFVSIKDQIDFSTSAGKLLAHLLGAFAEFEASLIKERVKAGLKAAKEKGTILGRPKKRNDRTIRQMRQRGYSFREIARSSGLSLGAVQCALKGYKKGVPDTEPEPETA